tara:strand:- start:909 stop:1361 length:453 start_codon:yes stop_codon:yes gene_type:complete
MKKIFWISILIFVTQCGYTALYKDNTNHNIKISLIKMSGDDQINKLIKTELKNYFKTETENEYALKINTNFQKNIITRDATGKPLEFRLELKTNVNINFDEKNIETEFNETFNIANSSDTFELKKYENIVKRNFARSTKEKIILKVVSLK